METTRLECGFCHKEFERRAWEVRQKRARGQKIFYCGKVCSMAHQAKLRNTGKQVDFKVNQR